MPRARLGVCAIGPFARTSARKFSPAVRIADFGSFKIQRLVVGDFIGGPAIQLVKPRFNVALRNEEENSRTQGFPPEELLIALGHVILVGINHRNQHGTARGRPSPMQLGFDREHEPYILFSGTTAIVDSIDDAIVSHVLYQPTSDEPDLSAIFRKDYDLGEAAIRHLASPWPLPRPEQYRGIRPSR